MSLTQGELDLVVELARELTVSNEFVEVDDIQADGQVGKVSIGEEGIWVAAWVFVSNSDVSFAVGARKKAARERDSKC